MGFAFATCCRSSALKFIQQACEGAEDTPESAGPLLDLVEQDIVRITDPYMYGTAQVIPSGKWDESYREQVMAACKVFSE